MRRRRRRKRRRRARGAASEARFDTVVSLKPTPGPECAPCADTCKSSFKSLETCRRLWRWRTRERRRWLPGWSSCLSSPWPGCSQYPWRRPSKVPFFHIGSLLVPEFVFISGYKYSTLGLKQNVKWKAFNYILESNVKTRQSRISRFTNWGEATFLHSATCRTVSLPAFSFILHNPQAPFKRNKLINEPFDFILLQNFTDVSWGWFICDISIKSKASLHFYLKQWQKNIWKSLPACLGPCLPGPPSVMQSSSYLRCR